MIRGLGKFRFSYFVSGPLLWALYIVWPGYWAEFNDVKNQLRVFQVKIEYWDTMKISPLKIFTQGFRLKIKGR